eukprot:TRINITY_DN328_c5_g1_i1.p1 TRINITY_DN328_c5_g1~~TRINITY_DN328_c5_g1_i1.p1  ORF type:complete len:1019 (+),score=392.40 TRINITY_DN328_c5_g1_i1:371-3058(+)
MLQGHTPQQAHQLFFLLQQQQQQQHQQQTKGNSPKHYQQAPSAGGNIALASSQPAFGLQNSPTGMGQVGMYSADQLLTLALLPQGNVGAEQGSPTSPLDEGAGTPKRGAAGSRLKLNAPQSIQVQNGLPNSKYGSSPKTAWDKRRGVGSASPSPSASGKNRFASVEAFTVAMASEARQRNRAAAEKVLAEAKEARCLNADVYKPLIRLYGELEDPDAAESVIDDMHTMRVSPDASVYGTLLAAHTRKKVNREAAERVLQRAKKEDKVNVQMFSCLMSLYGEIGEPERAEVLLKDMVESGVNPDANTYSTLIAAFARRKDIERAENILERAKHSGCVNADLYKPLMKLYGQLGDSERPEKLLVDMERNNVQPHASTYATLLAVHARQGQREKAEAVLQRAKKADKVNAHIYSPLMRLYGELEDSAAAENLLTEMLERKLTPDISIYATLLAVHAANNDREKAATVLARAKEKGFVGRQIYKGLMSLCSEQDDPAAAEYYLQDMLDDCKIAPSSTIFESIIASYCKGMKPDGAERVLQKALEQTPAVARIDAFKAIMNYCATTRDVPRARKLTTLLADKDVCKVASDEAIKIVENYDADADCPVRKEQSLSIALTYSPPEDREGRRPLSERQFLLGLYHTLHGDVFDAARARGQVLDASLFSNVPNREKRGEDFIRKEGGGGTPVIKASLVSPSDSVEGFDKVAGVSVGDDSAHDERMAKVSEGVARFAPQPVQSSSPVPPALSSGGSEMDDDFPVPGTSGGDLLMASTSISESAAPPLTVHWGDETEICGVCNLKVNEHRFCSATGKLHMPSSKRPSPSVSSHNMTSEPDTASSANTTRHATYDDSLVTALERMRNNPSLKEGVLSVVEQVLHDDDDLPDVFSGVFGGRSKTCPSW